MLHCAIALHASLVFFASYSDWFCLPATRTGLLCQLSDRCPLPAARTTVHKPLPLPLAPVVVAVTVPRCCCHCPSELSTSLSLSHVTVAVPHHRSRCCCPWPPPSPPRVTCLPRSVQTYWLRPELRRLSRGRSLGRVTAGVLTNTILPLSFDAAAVSP